MLYLRVHKTGSTTLETLLYKLSSENTGNSLKVYRKCVRCLFDPKHKVEFGSEFQSHPRPLMISGHVYFINFEEFNHTNPVWISMIRDPVKRYVSAFDFARTANSKVNK